MEHLLYRTIAFAASLLPLFLAAFSLQILPSVSSAPFVVTGAGYVTVNGTLYIQGGGRLYAQGGLYTDTNVTSAFVSLSLTAPWNDTSPPWKEINIPAQFDSRNMFQGLAVTPDKTRLVFWGMFTNGLPLNETITAQNDSCTVFNLLDNTWSKLTFLSNPVAVGFVPAIIDPTTPGKGLGVLYAPDGCIDSANIPGMCQMTLDKKKIDIFRMPGGLVPIGIKFFSFVYCTSRKTMLLYGGVGQKGEPNVSLYEYSTSTKAWSLLQPLGAPPGDIQRHCMVETTDGSKMIVFGGMNVGELVSSRLFILHINNMTWTEGPDIGAANARMGHVCATNGDSFVVWGGLTIQNGKAVVVTDIPLIYNIPNNAWVRNFVVTNQPSALPSNATLSSTATTPIPSDDVAPSPPPKKSSSSGATIGGALGGVVAVAVIGLLFYRQRKRAGNGDRHPSQFKGSSNNPSSFGKKGGFLDRSNNDGDTGGSDTYCDDPGTQAVQLQSASAQHTGDQYLPSSSQLVQQFQNSLSPQLHTGNSVFEYGSSPRNSRPVINMPDYSSGSYGELQSPRFSGVSSFLSPPPFQSVMSMSPTGSPQAAVGPVDVHNQSGYYDSGKDAFPSPFKSLNHQSPGSPYGTYPQYTYIGLDGQGVRHDLRSPQQPGPGKEASPTAWMEATKARNSLGNPHSTISEISSRGSYYPPPPGHQQPAQSESDLMQKKLILMKAQHELDLEKMRLEQESQRQLVEQQLVHGSG